MSVYDFKVRTIDGRETTLAEYRGKALLIVNTASECGYTPQYAGLEALYEKYRERGLVVLAFPSNDFGGQEPGTNAEIKKFCQLRYKTTFPLFAKIDVKGDSADPLYKYLTGLPGKQGGQVTWNFNKFLVAPDGTVVEHFDTKVAPDSPLLDGQLQKILPERS
ncbi:MAG TPA: glutathione peroxidase [Myxococcaceae bacterium]|nr:glutathione peroxidase [Myxococcaceae bacterium]